MFFYKLELSKYTMYPVQSNWNLSGFTWQLLEFIDQGLGSLSHLILEHFEQGLFVGLEVGSSEDHVGFDLFLRFEELLVGVRKILVLDSQVHALEI